jgi:hypothetical protein
MGHAFVNADLCRLTVLAFAFHAARVVRKIVACEMSSHATEITRPLDRLLATKILFNSQQTEEAFWVQVFQGP